MTGGGCGGESRQQKAKKKRELKTKTMDLMVAGFPDPMDDPFPVVDEIALNHWIYPSTFITRMFYHSTNVMFSFPFFLFYSKLFT